MAKNEYYRRLKQVGMVKGDGVHFCMKKVLVVVKVSVTVKVVLSVMIT